MRIVTHAFIWRLREQPPARQITLHDEPTIIIGAPARLKHAGFEIKLPVDGENSQRKPDHSFIRLLAQAHRDHAMVMRGDGRPITALTAEAGVARSYFARILRLSFRAQAANGRISDPGGYAGASKQSSLSEMKKPLPVLAAGKSLAA